MQNDMVMNAMFKLLLLTTLLLSCNDPKPTFRQVTLWDGKPGFAVECPSGSFLDCEDVKGKLCPQGYNTDSDQYKIFFVLRCREARAE